MAARKTAPASKAAELLAEVNKVMGKDTLRMATHDHFKTKYLPTGLLPLDLLFGGGIPVGRFVEVYGDYSTLKSYLGLNVCREVQKAGGVAAVIDTEHSFDSEWARELGVDTDDLIVQRPETGEEGITAAEVLTRGGVDFIMFDSIAASMPMDEQGKKMDQDKVQPGRQAAMMSAGLRRLTAANTHTAILFINQTRQKIGITFGSNESMPGGRAMPYYASHRIRLQKVGTEYLNIDIETGSGKTKTRVQTAQHFKAEITKSKLSRPFRDTYFDWDLVHASVNVPQFLALHGFEVDIVKRSGNTWSFGSYKATGRQNFIDMVSGSHELQHKMENELRKYYDLPLLPETSPKRPARKVAVVRPKRKAA